MTLFFGLAYVALGKREKRQTMTTTDGRGFNCKKKKTETIRMRRMTFNVVTIV